MTGMCIKKSPATAAISFLLKVCCSAAVSATEGCALIPVLFTEQDDMKT